MYICKVLLAERNLYCVYEFDEGVAVFFGEVVELDGALVGVGLGGVAVPKDRLYGIACAGVV